MSAAWRWRITNAIRSGTVIDLGGPDPTAKEGWTEVHTIPAAVIRECLLSNDLRPEPPGLRIRGALIEGELDLSYAELPCNIGLVACRLTALRVVGASTRWLSLDRSFLTEVGAFDAKIGRISLAGATVSNPDGIALDLDGVEIHGSWFADRMQATGQIRALGAKIGGRLSLRGATLSNTSGDALNLDGAEIHRGWFADRMRATGKVRAVSAKISGALVLREAILSNPDMSNPDADALNLDRAEIQGDWSANGLQAIGEVRARGAKIGQLTLQDATLFHPNGKALTLDGAEIQAACLANRLQATGEIRAVNAKIGGLLYVDDARLSAPGGNALTLDGAEIHGDWSADRLHATGEVRARGVRVGGQLKLNEVRLDNPGQNALNLGRAELRGDWSARKLRATGQVRARGAKIGELTLDDAVLTNLGDNAITLDRAEIQGDWSADRLTAEGRVRAHGVRVGGKLKLNEARLCNPGKSALNLGRAEIQGDWSAYKLRATGEVRARGAKVGQLSLNDAILSNPAGDALTLDRIEIQGDWSADRLRTTGRVRAKAATIGRQLTLRDATLSNRHESALGTDKIALNLERAEIAHLILHLTPESIGGLEAFGVGVRNLEVSGTLPTPLTGSGWSIGDLHGPVRTDRRVAQTWLDSAPRFVSQPWQEIAAVYEHNGQPADGRRLRFSAAHRTAKHSPGSTRIVRYAYGALVGYGYYPLLALIWLVLLAGLCWGVAVDRDSFAPTAAARATTQAGPACPGTPLSAATPRNCLIPDYPEYNPLLYAINTVTPGSLQDSAWAPTGTIRSFTVMMAKTAGWVLAAFLLAGLTGLLKKT
ncbi:hypothetical protein VV02_00250 [Luteipulveratus mongoliensis]|uniref:Membrane-associated oxidoreductase n=1 Tax=Luteipulveratus mongoliensis TaxID=571913 RepID=A0A0K1JDI4_9MICO|nr:hypothetical protein VV02_00250 [Luteipulveratus mongoliensis]